MLDHAQLLGIVLCILAVPFIFKLFNPDVPCVGSECWDGTEPTPSPDEMAMLNAQMNSMMQRRSMADAVAAVSMAVAGILAFRHAAPATVATLTGIGAVAAMI